MNEEGIEEDERHIEITIGDPVAEKVIDSCVGTVSIDPVHYTATFVFNPFGEIFNVNHNFSRLF